MRRNSKVKWIVWNKKWEGIMRSKYLKLRIRERFIPGSFFHFVGVLNLFSIFLLLLLYSRESVAKEVPYKYNDVA